MAAQQLPLLEKAFTERGEVRHEIRTVEELGFVFDERVEMEREVEEERRMHLGSSRSNRHVTKLIIYSPLGPFSPVLFLARSTPDCGT